ncbi:RNA polymerase sigma-54 factor [bacterium]|nr:MAG: RNA polymerase sigma-54 factor [bacterium]
MKLGINMKTSLSQTLTPQQIQYLKLLQLPLVQLEQHVQQQIEANPMLEDASFDDEDFEFEEVHVSNEDQNSTVREEMLNRPEEAKLFDESNDPFEFQKLLWDGTNDTDRNTNYSGDEDDEDNDMPYKSSTSESENLVSQLRLLKFTKEEYVLGEQIIGNIDNDGYLRRDLKEIVFETNQLLAELNYQLESRFNHQNNVPEENLNPAKQFALEDEERQYILKLKNGKNGKLESEHGILNEKILNSSLIIDSIEENENIHFEIFSEVTLKQAENVLYYIQHLDPPGIGSRTIQECLLAQLDANLEPNEYEDLAYEVIEKYYDQFSKKHYDTIMRELSINEDTLKKILDVIRGLNPKPGGNDYQNEVNTVTPDFVVKREEETGEIIISLNDNTIPELKLNKAYEKMRKEVKYRKFNQETRDWIRKKYDDAKFLIQAIKQRKHTMLMVMTAIAHLQEDFFEVGELGIKPLIYKAVAAETGLDISTVCRIVNGKYVRTDFGTYELKYFFSESLPNDEGEEVSTRIIKQKLKEVIDAEDKRKPHSDQKLSKLMKDFGFNVARRTIAKYREQLKIPVARLRKELL